MRWCAILTLAAIWIGSSGYAEDNERKVVEQLLERMEGGDPAAMDELLRMGLQASRILHSMWPESNQRAETIRMLINRLPLPPLQRFGRFFSGYRQNKSDSKMIHATIIESSEEFDVWMDVDYRRRKKWPAMRDGTDMLCLTVNVPEYGFKTIDLRHNGDENIRAFDITLATLHSMGAPARDSIDARLVMQTMMVERRGRSIQVKYMAPGDETTTVVFFSGGGLSLLDFPNAKQAQAEETFEKKDYLAVRRWLRRKRTVQELNSVNAMQFIRSEDPFTAYWAAKVVVAKGDYDGLQKRCEKIQRNEGMADYLVSSIFHAVMAAPVSPERDAFLSDPVLLRKICIMEPYQDPNYDRAGWLFPFLKIGMPEAKWNELMNAFAQAPDQEARDLADRVKREIKLGETTR